MRQPVGFKANFPSASIFTQDTFSFEMLQRLTPKTENRSGELFLRNIIFVFFAIRANHTSLFCENTQKIRPSTLSMEEKLWGLNLFDSALGSIRARLVGKVPATRVRFLAKKVVQN